MVQFRHFFSYNFRLSNNSGQAWSLSFNPNAMRKTVRHVQAIKYNGNPPLEFIGLVIFSA
jgi:hypothetical protein